jgi:hypothetical protein
MTEPYETPQSSQDSSGTDDPTRRRRSFWLRAIWISVIGVIVPPVIGLVGTVIGMKNAFGELSTNSSGIGDPSALSNHISTVLVSTAFGFMISVVAFIVLVCVLVRFLTLPKVPSLLQNPKQQAVSGNRR